MEYLTQSILPKIEFQAGSEKRFAEFISKLGSEKIALLSHVDLDGIASARVVSEAIQPDFIKFCEYNELNESLIKELKNQKVKTIIITDLFITDEYFLQALESFAKILIIDHHEIRRDFNSEKTYFLNSQQHCATFISYCLFSKTQNLENLDWLVACACISDWSYKNNQNWMSHVYKKYDDIFNLEKLKSGKMWNLQYTISLSLVYWEKEESIKKVFNILKSLESVKELKKYSSQVQEEIDKKVIEFEKNKEKIPGGWYFYFECKYPIKSIVINILTSKYSNETLIVVSPRENLYTISTRRQDNKINLDHLLKDATKDLEGAEGGGHSRAAGAHILKKDLQVFKQKIIDLLKTKYKV